MSIQPVLEAANKAIEADKLKPKAFLDAVQQAMEGVKHDQGKPSFHLFPGDALAEVGRVLDYGATKYAPRNWEKGMNWLRPWNACMRHLWAWVGGEDNDPETGINHLAHACCNLLFLLAYAKRKVGTDDRNPGR